MTWHPDMPMEYRNRIVTGDARELAKRIPDESVDLVFTDPVYDRIDDYRWLAETAMRILKSSGMVIAQVGSEYRFDAECAMRRSLLKPLPLLAEVYPRARTYLYKYRVMQGWKPHLWFSKNGRGGDCVFDRTQGKGADKRFHNWGDSQQFIINYFERLTNPLDTIFDPFTGSGTIPAVCKMLGRNYVAFEIDPATADLARERVANTQPPLFVLEPEQLELENMP